MATTTTLAADVRRAVAAVEDPEYPGITIDELGILGAVRVGADGLSVDVELLPTRLGCPALDMIRRDVEDAAAAVPGVERVTVAFSFDPPWTPDRISDRARRTLSSEFTVTLRTPEGGLRCPVCGSAAVETISEVGPAPCRAVARCLACRNPVEVVR